MDKYIYHGGQIENVSALGDQMECVTNRGQTSFLDEIIVDNFVVAAEPAPGWSWQQVAHGESLSDAEKQHRVYSAWLPGTAWYWGQVVQDLKRLKVETGSLACLGCKRERQCATKGCFIIREALCLLGVSDTSQQAKEKLHQGGPLVE